MIKKILALSIGLALLSALQLTAEAQDLGVTVIDDFEANNPASFYTMKALDQSTVDLFVSHKAKVDGGAMQINYSLSTQRSVPSQVQLTREPLTNDWSGVTELKMWVKGDASGNVFKMFVVDDDDEFWEFEDHNILLSDTWNQLSMPIDSFVLTTNGNIGNHKIDLGNIRYFGFIIEGRTPENVSGIVYLDDFIGAGPELPKRAPTKIGLPKGKVKVSTNLSADSQYRVTPENNTEWFNLFTVKLAGQAGNYSTYIELAPYNNSSEAAFGITDNENANYPVSGMGLGANWINAPGIGQVNYAITATDLPYLTSLQLGRLWIDYGALACAPPWGYEGIQGEGKLGILDYHAFVIKHVYDAATFGTQLNLKWNGFEARTVYVYSDLTGRKPSSLSDASTVTSAPLNKTTAIIFDDAVAYFELLRKFGNTLVLKGTYASDTYRSDAYADLSNYQDPIYLGERPPSDRISQTDFLRIGRLELYLFPGNAVHFEYRSIGPNYLPRWRGNRVNFSHDDGNQKGTSLYVSQDIPFGFSLSGLFVDFKRTHDDQYYKHDHRIGISHKPFKGLDTSFSREYLDEFNNFNETRYGFNTSNSWNLEAYINSLQVNYEFSQSTRLTTKYDLWQGYDRGLAKNMANHSLKFKLEEWFSANAYLSGEYIYTQYSNPTDAPQGYPFEDNRTQIEMKVNF